MSDVNDELVAALEPFAAMASAGDQRPADDAVWAGQDGRRITYGDFRRAQAALARPKGGEGAWRPIETAPTDGPSFLICTDRRNVYVVFRRSDEGARFLHFAPGPAREVFEEPWGWKPSPESLTAALQEPAQASAGEPS